MCGIAGFALTNGGNRQALTRRALAMNTAIAHRGPDGDGIWVDEAAGVALAQRRLAIVDLSETGAQPMISASGRFVITYNGEIYNFQELRAELEQKGVQFRGTSDTEVLLEGWAQWGADALLPRLNGMFAFAVWDRDERQLTLVRDAFGIKPLLWFQTGEGFFFGSELKALAVDKACPKQVDSASVAALLRNGNVPAPWTIYQGVHKLMPGTVLRWRAGEEPEVRSWWSPLEAARAGQTASDRLSFEEAVDQGETLISDAVQRQMVADVPLGAFLSGGIDSSLVAALMQKQSARKVDTFTIGFEEPEWDEAPHAQAVAKHLGTNHHTLQTSGREALALVDEIGGIYDEPFADSSQLPTLLLSRMVRKHVTVALSGDGGDETFAGYARHGWGLKLARYQAAVPQRLRQSLSSSVNALPTALLDKAAGLIGHGNSHAGHKIKRVLRMGAANNFSDGYRQMTSLTVDPAGLLHLANEHKPIGFSAASTAGLDNPLSRMQMMDVMSYLPDDILVKVDRASMSVGLEVRVPLLDHRIWEWAMRLPVQYRRDGGNGKRLLRAILARHVPPALFERPKTGFAVPLARWLRTDLRDWAEALLSPRALEDRGVNSASVHALWKAHQSGTEDHAPVLWSILMLQSWSIASSQPEPMHGG
ncbi:MAG: asparagine synthase (glutamine-hydrolyzing) [Beijerinckiaceae bacterium]